LSILKGLNQQENLLRMLQARPTVRHPDIEGEVSDMDGQRHMRKQ
jgi:hypothetical protein